MNVQTWLDRHPWALVVVFSAAAGSTVMAFALAKLNGSLIGCIITGLAALGLFYLLANETFEVRERQGNELFDDIDDHP